MRLACSVPAALCLLLLAACAAVAPEPAAKRTPRPPNILFVLADDLGVDSTRFYPQYDPQH
jgi:hypothetical protein